MGRKAATAVKQDQPQPQEKPHLRRLPAAVYAKQPEQPQAAQDVVKPILVTDGDEQINALAAPVVTFEQLAGAGDTLTALAFNVLAGTFNQELATKQWPRALKNEKVSFVKLVAVIAAYSREQLVSAWEQKQAASKRKARVTLSGLVRAASEFGLIQKKEGAISPMVRLVSDLTEILDGKGSDADKVKRIRARLEEVGQKD